LAAKLDLIIEKGYSCLCRILRLKRPGRADTVFLLLDGIGTGCGRASKCGRKGAEC
jgi:hypothetical protein